MAINANRDSLNRATRLLCIFIPDVSAIVIRFANPNGEYDMMKSLLLRTSLLCVIVGFPTVATAESITGTTVGGPTWNRPLAGSPPTFLSALGTNVAYATNAFTVSADGGYTFLNTATNPPAWDNFLFLYVGSFDPANQFANAIVGNDDFGAIGLSGFNANLTAGLQYIAVTTGFNNDDAGEYLLDINGPGTVSFNAGAVPEPSAWAMMILGFGVAGAAMRMRRRRSVKVSYSV